MNHVLTFFRERRPGGEEPRRLRVQVARRKLSLYFHGAAPLADVPASSVESFDRLDDFQRFRAGIEAALAHGEGGLLVTAEDRETGVNVEVRAVRPQGSGAYAPPGTLFSVDTEEGLREHPLAEPKTELDLPTGAHLILPADAAAEARFRSFRSDYLAWFPRDFETLMLGVLRKPGLDLMDSRIARLEEILLNLAGSEPGSRPAWFERLGGKFRGRGRLPAGEGAEGTGGSMDDPMAGGAGAGRFDFGKSPWLAAALAGALGVGLGAGYGWGIRAGEQGTGAAAEGGRLAPELPAPRAESPPPASAETPRGAGAGAAPGAPESTSPPGETAPPDPVSRLRDVVSRLSRSAPNTALASLWDSHFKPIPGIAGITEASAEKLYGQPSFLWGMLKLPALLAAPPKKSDMFWDSTDRAKATASAYKELLDSPTGILAEPSVRAMLADLACRLREAAADRKPRTSIEKNFFGADMKTLFSGEPCRIPAQNPEERARALNHLIEALDKQAPANP